MQQVLASKMYRFAVEVVDGSGVITENTLRAPPEAGEDDPAWLGAVDALESFLLAYATVGGNLAEPKLGEAVEIAMEACAENL